VLGEAAVGEAEQMELARAKPPPGRGVHLGLAAGREHHERAGVDRGHPPVADHLITVGHHVQFLEAQLGEGQAQPRAGGKESGAPIPSLATPGPKGQRDRGSLLMADR
jgi:hypothetical protein